MLGWAGLVFALVLSGCGRIAFEAIADGGGADGGGADGGGDAPGDTAGACTWGPWSPATELAVLDSVDNDYDPTLSPDGLTIYFCTTRDGAEFDLFTSTRASRTAAWAAPVPVPAVATASQNECNPEVSVDGLELYFGVGTVERVTRTSTTVAFAAPREILLGDDEIHIGPIGPDLASDMLTLYYGAQPVSGPPSRLYRITRPSRGAAFGAPTVLPGQTDPLGWAFPTVSGDELEMVYSTRSLVGDWELGVLTRSDRNSSFGGAALLSDVNTINGDADAELSADRSTLMFTSDRPGGTGGWDLYEVTRGCL